jgi:UDP-N-acetylmuramate: L-alanyl-gamma-D-glutamyl-meso-diaminopimelate ligase
MLTWILQCAGENPGFLVGGVPFGFEGSARLGSGPFVVEADEYDSAFFDKRSKFVHYRPKTLVINNLEFDHADIFDDLAAIQTQFHHLIRCVPSSGKIVAGEGEAIDGVLRRGVWTPVERMGSSDTNTWSVDALTKSYSQLSIQAPDGECCEFAWSLIGRHNAENALSAIAAAFDVGVPVHVSCEALSQFQGVKRRLELLGEPAGVSVYDDFAHHPTAIASTLSGVRSLVEDARVIAVVELRSNTMKDGTHRSALIPATASADNVFWFQPEGAQWSLRDNTQNDPRHHVFNTVGALHDALVAELQAGDHVVIMSNGSFSGLHQQLLQSLTDSASNTEY